MRAFVAVELDAAPEGPAPEHLTLRFLGEIPPEEIDALAAALSEAVREMPAFEFTLDGVGAFPSRERPRVVWWGARGGAERLRELAARVDDALDRAGHPKDRESFVPHVTLFRVRSSRDVARARALLDGSVPLPPPRPVRVRQIVLKESRLGPEGARHRTVRAFPLAGAGPP